MNYQYTFTAIQWFFLFVLAFMTLLCLIGAGWQFRIKNSPQNTKEQILRSILAVLFAGCAGFFLVGMAAILLWARTEIAMTMIVMLPITFFVAIPTAILSALSAFIRLSYDQYLRGAISLLYIQHKD